MVSDRVCPERAIGFMAGVSICVRPGVRRVWARSTQLSVNRSSHKYEVGQRGLRGLELRTSDTPSIPYGLYSAGGPPRWPCASNQGSGRNGPEAEGTLYELISRILLHRSVCAARKEAAHRRRATFQCGQSIGEVGVRMGSRTGGRLRSGYGVREETAVRRKRCFAEHEPCFLVRVRFEVGN